MPPLLLVGCNLRREKLGVRRVFVSPLVFYMNVFS